MKRALNSPFKRSKQAGAALLTAMIIVTLVASLASAMVWRQYRAVQIEAAERARAQAAWILQGSLDWARLILREDAIENQRVAARGEQPMDHLGEVWAVPLAEARLSTFLAAEKSNAEDGPEAFLSGSLEDAQARYNLRNLLSAGPLPALEKRVLERLCTSASAPPGTADLIIKQLRAAFDVPSSPQGGASAPNPGPATASNSTEADKGEAPLQPKTLDQMTWLGLSLDTVERLRPLLILLPSPTPVNLNTAPRDVIAALFDNMDLASAERLVQARQSNPLKTIQDAAAYFPPNVVLSADRAATTSSFFIVKGRLRLEERVLEERSLIQRRGRDMVVLDRQRVSQSTDGKP
ncbi:type II secretion system minor pseudopilin GspK [Paucibacter sp. Y2R2-4]|uniref:type II secretion system minor pseudopilin GspK n=1 Tax=Paucibacter sp. Y2R2-4 TaxID=2893553 RepID=UPI0021E40507|nr:type II secretion system minor pseudopilin GspK [Paucibacter sp. Y2R2-4]MCV2350050.1 type II secretion system minor pseudopilin GspK [Paucibacter sp. Y2R2-4]